MTAARPLDIAIVHHLPEAGGAPRVLAEYVTRRPQHRFTVYTRMPQAPPELRLVALPEEVTVHRLALREPRSGRHRLWQLARLGHYGRTLAARIDAAGHDVVFAHASVLVQAHEVLPHLRTPTLAYAPEPLRALYEPMPVFGAPASLRARLVRAGLDPYEALRKRLDRRHIQGADTIVTHSRFTASNLERIYGVRAGIVTLGVDGEAFSPAGVPRERTVLSVGALHPLKGHQDVIAAVATIPGEVRPRVVIVGDRGALAEELGAQARRLAVQLELLQGLPHDRLVDEYRRAGVVAAAMLREPFGLVTLEAMACGAAVVAVAEGGLLETVLDGQTGLLVARDPAALGAALGRVLDDRALAARLGAAGRAAAVRDWSWERTADAFDDLLAALAARGPRG